MIVNMQQLFFQFLITQYLHYEIKVENYQVIQQILLVMTL